MTSEQQKSSKTFPTILSKLRAMKDASGPTEGGAASTKSGGSRDHGEDGSSRGRRQDLGSSGCSSDLREMRGTPRLAWVATRKDSTLSSVSSHDAASRPVGMLSRIPSAMSLGGSTSPWGKRLKKKRDAEEYAAQKLARQKEEMIAFYKGTPVVDDRATSTEILRFLYEMWQPQLCASYRPDARITTTCRQDMRSARRIAQTASRRLVKLHRARLIIDTCNQMDHRRASLATGRPRSARSIT
ncbi:hypothetical protein PoB_000786600 [Plakobranchus ocellatus]|uniref:Uncharacterized protein n=1 Tax=Plakobranchus ocellatus TaxID=259542 RepID=A0AAV3YDV2_9GAST|nr:hypothetical protein PoB_000786600 [Plakobranchus ocellatus]